MPKKAITIICTIIFCTSLVGCGHQTKNNLLESQPDVKTGQQHDYQHDILPRYESENVSFDIPAEWQKVHETSDSIMLKDTDLEIMLSSGFVPEDYYLPSGVLNDEKYADKYIAVRLETYDFQINSESDWTGFVDEYFPQIEKFEITEINGHMAIEPNEFSGILLGDKIMFIDLGENVIGAFLHHQGRDKDEAKMYFSQILNSLD